MRSDIENLDVMLENFSEHNFEEHENTCNIGADLEPRRQHSNFIGPEKILDLFLILTRVKTVKLLQKQVNSKPLILKNLFGSRGDWKK